MRQYACLACRMFRNGICQEGWRWCTTYISQVLVGCFMSAKDTALCEIWNDAALVADDSFCGRRPRHGRRKIGSAGHQRTPLEATIFSLQFHDMQFHLSFVETATPMFVDESTSLASFVPFHKLMFFRVRTGVACKDAIGPPSRGGGSNCEYLEVTKSCMLVDFAYLYLSLLFFIYLYFIKTVSEACSCSSNVVYVSIYCLSLRLRLVMPIYANLLASFCHECWPRIQFLLA